MQKRRALKRYFCESCKSTTPAQENFNWNWSFFCSSHATNRSITFLRFVLSNTVCNVCSARTSIHTYRVDTLSMYNENMFNRRVLWRYLPLLFNPKLYVSAAFAKKCNFCIVKELNKHFPIVIYIMKIVKDWFTKYRHIVHMSH